MKNKFKKIALLVCAGTLALSLCACGKSAEKTDGKAGNAEKEDALVAGETYDTGNFTVTVPNGWLAVPVSDMFDEYDGDTDPTALTLIKDGKEEWDTFDHVWIRINIYDKDSYVSGKDWYDDVKDLDPVTVSGFDCSVYSCTSAEYPYVMLEGSDANHDIAVSILTKNDNYSIDYKDADVQTILKTIVVK